MTEPITATLPPLPEPTDVVASSRATADWKGLLLGAVVGGFIALFGLALDGWLGDDRVLTGGAGFTGVTRILLATALVLSVPLVLLAHELGHLLAGRLVGFRFRMLIVGPLVVSREAGRIRLSVNRSIALAGGLASSLPEDVRDLRNRLAWMVAGGPLLSLLLGAALWAGALLLAPAPTGPDAPSFLHLYLRTAIPVLALASIAIAAVTLIPGRTSGFYTDGARLLLLWKGGAPADREVAVWHLITCSATGVRPRNWPPEPVVAAVALEDGTSFECVARSLAYAHALDRQDIAAAGQHLGRALALWGQMPPAAQANVVCEAAFFEAGCRGDPVRGRAWLDSIGASPHTDDALRLRAEAAVLAAEGRLGDARELTGRHEAALAGRCDTGLAEAARQWLKQALEAAQV